MCCEIALRRTVGAAQGESGSTYFDVARRLKARRGRARVVSGFCDGEECCGEVSADLLGLHFNRDSMVRDEEG